LTDHINEIEILDNSLMIAHKHTLKLNLLVG